MSDEQIEYGRRFPDGEVIPSAAGYVDDPRWLTCAGQPVAWVQRTVTYSDWTPRGDAGDPCPRCGFDRAGGYVGHLCITAEPGDPVLLSDDTERAP